MNIKQKLRLFYGISVPVILFFAVIMPMYILAVAAFSMVAGIEIRISYIDTEREREEKSRAVAMLLAYLPGLGHIYLGERRRACGFILMYLAYIPIFVLIALYDADDLYLMVIFIAVLFQMIFTSLLDTEMICNRRNMVSEYSVMEFRIKNFDLAYLTLSLCATIFISMAAAYSLFHFTEENELPIYAVTVTIWIVLTMFFAKRYLKRRQ